jgi:hypothetical protein
MQETPGDNSGSGPDPIGGAPAAPPPPPPAATGYVAPTKGLFDRARDIILRPAQEWPLIEREPGTVGSVFVPYALILAAISPLAGLIGGQLFGYSLGFFSWRPPLGGAVAYALVSYALSLASVYILALIVDALAPNFGGIKNQVNAVKLAVYSWTAAWLAGIFALFPPLAILSLVGLYSLYLLYSGLPVMMKCPRDKASGYAAVVIGLAIILWIVVGWLAWRLMVGMMMPTIPIG